MSGKTAERLALQNSLKLVKQEEARYRYLMTSAKTSPEFRKEASAKLQEARERIYQLSLEIAALDVEGA